jgi:V8-like Glu-specific endopeptidase
MEARTSNVLPISFVLLLLAAPIVGPAGAQASIDSDAMEDEASGSTIVSQVEISDEEAAEDLLAGTQVLAADCPSTCSSSEIIIGCDDRFPKPNDVDGATKAPWRFTGRFDDPKCTGALIDGKFILTCAHCMMGRGDAPMTFSLAQEAEAACRRPYGSYAVRRIWIPRDFGGTDKEEDRALDFAIAELWTPIAGATPAHWGYMKWSKLKNKRPRSVGYPFVIPGPPWTLGTPWATGAQEFLSSQPYRWIDGGERGLLYTTLDGTGGQSGSPVYVFNNGRRKIIGVLLGSPVAACEAGQNWVARLTPDIVEHIKNVIDPRTLDFWWEWTTLEPTSTIPPCDGDLARSDEGIGVVEGAPSSAGAHGDAAESASGTALLRVFPNPARMSASIQLAMEDVSSNALLAIHDVTGRLVRTCKVNGSREFVWDMKGDDGVRVASGVYFVRLRDGGKTVATQRLLVTQ